MRMPEQFETSRLLLRKIRMDDSDWMFERYTTDPEVSRYLRWAPHTRIEETIDFVRGAVQRWDEDRNWTFVIEEKQSGQGIGTIDARDQSGDLELGYVLARPFWGQGYATEATRALVEWAKAAPDVHRVHAYVDPDNPASGRVLEKAGLTFERILPHFGIHPNVSDEPRDIRLYAWN